MRHLKRFYSLCCFVLLMMSASIAITNNAMAQSTQPTAVTQSTIRAVQEALSRQGIVITPDGILNDTTREAIRKYQSQHHLPVTGEPDQATLNKLGVLDRSGSAVDSSNTLVQGPAGSGAQPSGQMPMQGNMMNCSMMQGQMQTMQGQMLQMMQMMQGMMQMMQSMKGQMPPTGR